MFLPRAQGLGSDAHRRYLSAFSYELNRREPHRVCRLLSEMGNLVFGFYAQCVEERPLLSRGGMLGLEVRNEE